MIHCFSCVEHNSFHNCDANVSMLDGEPPSSSESSSDEEQPPPVSTSNRPTKWTASERVEPVVLHGMNIYTFPKHKLKSTRLYGQWFLMSPEQALVVKVVETRCSVVQHLGATLQVPHDVRCADFFSRPLKRSPLGVFARQSETMLSRHRTYP